MKANPDIARVRSRLADVPISIDQTAWHGQTLLGQCWSIYQGQAADVLDRISPASIDCVITSPPYYWLRDYGVEGQIGLEDTVEGYVEHLVGIMDNVMRLLKPEGVLFLNIGDTYYSGRGESHGSDKKSTKRRFGLRAVDKSGGLGLGLQKKSIIGIPWRVAIKMSARGWILRSPIIWHRENCLPEAVNDRPRRSYEYVFMFVKSRRYFFNRKPLVDQKVEEDMWTIAARPRPTNGIDTAPYPDELVERCIEIACPEGGVVLDPFVGGGTTVRVALRMLRSAIGIDLKPEFCEYCVRQLREAPVR